MKTHAHSIGRLLGRLLLLIGLLASRAATPAHAATTTITTCDETTLDAAISNAASDPAGNSTSGSFQVIVQDKLPPSLQLPSSPVTVNASSPQGAPVTATDPVYPSNQLTINGTLASGSTFAIGTTTVTCTVTDPAGNSANGSFQVVVVGASGQVTSTISLVNSFGLPAAIQAGFDTQVQAVQTDLTNTNPTQACSDLKAFITHVQAQSGKHLIVSQANQLLAAAKQIPAVLGC